MFGFGNKANTADATIRVGYNGKEASNGIKSLGTSFKLLAGSIGGLFALQKVNAFINESTDLAKRQIQAEQGLSQALGKTSQSLLSHASALQKKTTYGDEAIIEAQTLVSAFIREEDQIKKLTPAILDLAAAKKMDLSSAADLVTKSVASSTNALSRYGIQIEGAAGSTERIDSAVREITRAFGGMAESLAKTDVGKLEQMANELGDIKEKIGIDIIPLQITWNKLLLEATRGATAILIPFIKLQKILFTSRTFEDERIDNAIELAKITKDESNLLDEHKNKLSEIEKINKKIEGVRKSKFFQSMGEKQIEIEIEALMKKKLKIRDQEQKIASAIFSLRTKEKEVEARPIPERPEKEEKEKKEKITTTTVAVYEGYAEGLEQRERLEKDAEEKRLAEEERYISSRREAWGKLKNLNLSATEIRLRDENDIINRWREQNVISKKEFEKLKSDIQRQEAEERIQIEREELQKRIAINQQGINSFSTINRAILGIIDNRTQKEIANLEKLNLSEQEFSKKRDEIMAESNEKRMAFARIQQGIAIAEATVNVYKAATEVYATEIGGYFVKSLAMGAAIAEGLLTVSQIEAQNLQTGKIGIGGIERTRQIDNIPIMAGRGESVISAPQTAMHEDTLKAIQNNTANTARGMRYVGKGGGDIINNYYGVSTEQLLSTRIDTNRRKMIGRRL